MTMKEPQSLFELKQEIVSLKKSNALKDDQIGFLQREKEHLLKEVKHYETVCSGVEANVALHHRYEQELKQLRADIQHWKEVVSRHRQARKNSLSLEQQHRTLLEEVQRNSQNVLSGIQSDVRQLDEVVAYHDHDTCWKLLRVCSGTLAEAHKQLSKYKFLIEATTPAKPMLRYSHSVSEGIPHSQQPRSALVKLAKQSMANALVSSSSFYTPKPTAETERRSQTVNTLHESRPVGGFLPGLAYRHGKP